VSPDKSPGIFLVQKQMDTLDSLQYGMQPNLYSLNTFKCNQFFLQASRCAALNSYYDNMKPFVLVMRAMGVLPVSPTEEGKNRHGVTISMSLGNC
jgi:hypothetical protein